MFFTLPRPTPGYIRLLQVSNVDFFLSVPAGMAMFMGAVGIGVCGYSSRQLTMNHQPSSRVLKWAGNMPSDLRVPTAGYRSPPLDVPRRSGAYHGISPPSFVAQKVSVK
uniref:Uncharacterized protein n=1 Tax=Periophthalmus magnuspinnatus TaxID=409849 RepID=A0A3B4AAT9_9GOBI